MKKQKSSKILKHFRADSSGAIVLIIFVGIVFFFNIKEIGPRTTLQNFLFRVRNFNSSYDDKMRFSVGTEFYDYTLFIKENTPEDAVILIPPQAYPWPQTGNAGYIRYFVFPRKVINGAEFEPGINLEENKIGYALFLWGDFPISEQGSTPGWPKFDLKAEYKLYLLPGGQVQKVFGDYNQKEIQKNTGLKGVIKLKN